MVSSFSATIVFYVTSLVLFLGVFRIKKSEKTLNAVTWCIMSVLIVVFMDAFFCGIVNLIKIPVNLYLIDAINLLLGVIVWNRILLKKQLQSYVFKVFDIISAILIVILGIGCAYIQFGFNLDIHFSTSDPAIHFRNAMDFINNESLTQMNLGPFCTGLFISLFSPFLASYDYYKLYILAEIFFFIMSGLTFFALVRNFSVNRFDRLFLLVVTSLYMLGYPLNDMVFGFGYLGIGVTVVIFVLFASDCFTNNYTFKWIAITLLMLGCYGIVLCYSLFAPVVFLGVFSVICWYFIRQKAFFTRKMVYTQLGVFLLPAILGIVYSYFMFFNGSNAGSVSSAIANEGYIYRDLYSNFIIFLPLSICGFFVSIRRKEWTSANGIFVCLFLFMLALFYLGLKGLVSSYYYYKTYYLMWLVVFYLAQRGVIYLSAKSKPAIVSYAVVWGFVGIMSISGLDTMLNNKYLYFDPSVKASCYLDIYRFNWLKMSDRSRDYPAERLILYQYVVENCSIDKNPIFLCDDWSAIFWYEGITNQRLNAYYYWENGEENTINLIQETCIYVVINPKADISKHYESYFNSLVKVYETDWGYVALIKNQ